MAHHGQDGPPSDASFASMLRDLRREQLSHEGSFPEGRMEPSDQGALAFAVGNDGTKVVITFPKPIDWMGFGPEQAREIAQKRLDHAESCDGIHARVRRQYPE